MNKGCIIEDAVIVQDREEGTPTASVSDLTEVAIRPGDSPT